MKITRKNYKVATKDIDFSKLPEAIQEGHQDFDVYNELYTEDKGIAEVVDIYLEKLNEVVAKSTKKKSTKPAKKKPSDDSLLIVDNGTLVSLTRYAFAEDHPLMILEKGSSQFQSALQEFYDETLKMDSKPNEWKLLDERFSNRTNKWDGFKDVTAIADKLTKLDVETLNFFYYDGEVFNEIKNTKELNWAQSQGYKIAVDIEYYGFVKHLFEKKSAKKDVKKKLNAKGLKVEIRKASPRSKKFIVWDVKTDQKFANETFVSKKVAKDFIDDNAMVLVESAPKKKPATKKPKASPCKYDEHDYVEHYPEDVRLLKRFLGAIGKEKQRRTLLNIYKDMERRITEGKVNKKAENAALIPEVSARLKKALDAMARSGATHVTLQRNKSNDTFIAKVEQAVEGKKIRASVPLMKSFVGIEGEIKPEKAKVERLLKRFNSALERGKVCNSDIFWSEFKEAKTQMVRYIGGEIDTIPIKPQALTGVKK